MTIVTLLLKRARHRKQQKRHKALYNMLQERCENSPEDANSTDLVTGPYAPLNRDNSRLAHFVGSETNLDSEPAERLLAANCLGSPETHAKLLQNHPVQVQTAQIREDILPSWPAIRAEKESFEAFIDKGSSALIKDHKELVEKLI